MYEKSEVLPNKYIVKSNKILAAIIVEKDKDLEASKSVDEIKDLLELDIKKTTQSNSII